MFKKQHISSLDQIHRFVVLHIPFYFCKYSYTQCYSHQFIKSFNMLRDQVIQPFRLLKEAYKDSRVHTRPVHRHAALSTYLDTPPPPSSLNSAPERAAPRLHQPMRRRRQAPHGQYSTWAKPRAKATLDYMCMCILIYVKLYYHLHTFLFCESLVVAKNIFFFFREVLVLR